MQTYMYIQKFYEAPIESDIFRSPSPLTSNKYMPSVLV